MVDPLHQFVISPIVKMSAGGVDLSFTNSSLAVVVAVLGIWILFAWGTSGINSGMVPSRLQAALEICYNMVLDLLDNNTGEGGRRYFPFVFSLFFFILFSNLVGIIPYMFTTTSHIVVTFALAGMVFCVITLLGFMLHGVKFLGVFAPSGAPRFLLPLLIPIEMISYLSRPISLSVRLFANMMAGHTVLKVFAGFAAMLGVWGIFPLFINVLLTGFELAIAIIQSYVFTILTCVYLRDAVHLH